MSAFYGFVTLCLFGIALAELRRGVCPDIKTMPDFEIDNFSGRWFQTKRYFRKVERHAKCVMADYALRYDGTIKFQLFQINTSTGKSSSLKGSLLQPSPYKPGKLKMKFHEISVNDNFWILGTDYENYAVIYTCKNVKPYHDRYAWILTREQNPSESVIKRAFAVAAKHNVNTKLFINTDQTHCIA